MVLLTLALALSNPVRAGAADIGDALATRWATASADEFIPVLVRMRDRVEIDRDLPELAYGHVAMSDRHALVLGRLKDRALQSQARVRTDLQRASAQGLARRVHHFWIDNMVGLEATPALLDDLARRTDIEQIDLLPGVVIDEPEVVRATIAASPASHELGLDVIGAPAMWALGYTGKGRIVCGIDTGVRGSHDALAARWRGLKVPSEQAWHDPRGLTSFPQDIGTNPLNHGSHTMGTMCGADPVLGDTVGVAPGAEWIAAFGIGSSQLTTLDLIAALEWAADPDGNPNTTSDVPDVLNCSWRFNTTVIQNPCNDIMDGTITNLEAAGVIVVWSAGNEGSAPETIGYPANSVNAFGTNFAVGNINGSTLLIHGSSSRGPTPCAGDSIKPEVVAPGVNIRSCYRSADNAYGTLTGTSMAAPHVAGAAAILRQVAPDATPAQIKQALYVSAIDKGVPGEDNDYGNGLIDIPAAADSLSVLMGGPDLRVESEQVAVSSPPGVRVSLTGVAAAAGDSLNAGDTVSLTFTVRNRAAAAATSAWLKLVEIDPYVTLLVDSVSLGIVAADDVVAAPALRFVIADGTPAGQPLLITLELGATGYASSRPLQYFTYPAPRKGLFTHDNTLVTLSVSNFGLYGLGDRSYNPFGGQGFLHDPNATDHMAEAALVIGVSQSQVSDAARRSGGADAGYQINDADFAVSPGGALLQVSNIETAFQTTYSVFDDAAAENPIGIRVHQRSLIFPRGGDEGYVLLIYTLENVSAGALLGLRIGMLHDCDFPQFLAGSDTTGFDNSNHLAYMFDETQIAAGPYRGVAVVSAAGASSYRSINSQIDLYVPGTFETILTDSAKWAYLSGGIGPSSVGTGTYGDAATFVGTGPFNLFSPGDTVQVAFAFVASEDGYARLAQNTQAAKSRYVAIASGTAVDEPGVRPLDFALYPNYPNPFNPDTRIRFALQRPGHARLVIYNLLGQTVATLFDARVNAGEYEVDWNGHDERGRAAGTGVYFYRLSVDDAARTRKMLLLR